MLKLHDFCNRALERTEAGIKSAKAKGVRFGRPPTLSDAQWKIARELLDNDPPRTVSDIATLLNVSRQAIYRRLERDRSQVDAASSHQSV
jgi:DNA invertase Pin-like site-specific DNA recombinase